MSQTSEMTAVPLKPERQSSILPFSINLKTREAIDGQVGKPRLIKPSLREFSTLLEQEK